MVKKDGVVRPKPDEHSANSRPDVSTLPKQRRTNPPEYTYTQVQTALDLTEKSVILEPQNPTIDEFHLVQKRRPTDFETLKLRNVRSGIFEITYRKVELSVLFHSEKENTFLFVYFFALKIYFRTSV